MTWKKEQSGNPSGGPRDKLFADALRVASHEIDEPSGKRKLRRIAEKLVECALNGEGWAIQQVADRLDGKPAQQSTLTVQDKHDATDWSTAELEQILNDAYPRRSGTATAKQRQQRA